MEVSLGELSNVKGIGKKTLERIREYKLTSGGYISEYNGSLHLERNSINQGDCLELMNGIKDNSVDMILADLPYGTVACSWDSIIDLDKLWLQYERVIKKDDGAIVLTADGVFTFKLYHSNPELFKYKLVWDKKHSTGFLNANRMPLRQHEDILIFYKNLPTYNPIMETRGKPRQKGSYNKKKGNGDMCYNSFDNIEKYNNKYYPTSILTFSSANQKDKIHPTQKPVALFEYLIKTYTNKGDLVLDNVSGSGTTAVACINTSRNYICIEQNKKYYEQSVERVKNLKN